MSRYVIGSFNIRKFNTQKEFDKIASIILCEKMDVVAIQEVYSKFAVDSLVKALNCRRNFMSLWNGVVPPYPKPMDSTGETYAFIWNEKRLSLLDIRGKLNPRFIDDFVVKGVPGQRRLLRDPYYARFTAKGLLGGTSFELRLINAHVRYSKGPADDLCLDSALQMRKNELDVLIKEILPKCEDSRTGHNMPAYTFLVGDYNLCLENGGRSQYTISRITEGNQKTWKRYYRTVQELPTSLKKPIDDTSIDEEEDIEAGQMTVYEDYYSKNYDHFTYNQQLDDKMSIVPSRVEPIDVIYSDDQDRQERLRKYRNEISDHVPIKITVDLISRR